ncbi:18539_t:CDS:2 [Funneliformis geosporum]|nr:18539_t:CDS:2 [Funneliformis geosporum]
MVKEIVKRQENNNICEQSKKFNITDGKISCCEDNNCINGYVECPRYNEWCKNNKNFTLCLSLISLPSNFFSGNKEEREGQQNKARAMLDLEVLICGGEDNRSKKCCNASGCGVNMNNGGINTASKPYACTDIKGILRRLSSNLVSRQTPPDFDCQNKDDAGVICPNLEFSGNDDNSLDNVITTPTPITTDVPSNVPENTGGLSASNKIALGTGIGLGTPIENFRDELQKSEHPGVEIHNNIYTTKLPPLNQDYKNVSKRKIKISNDFNPDDYIRKYDIVERKIKELFGFAHHFAIYLGNGEVAHISHSEREKNKGQFVEIHHPFIPFKKPELIQKHVDIAINAKYGEGEYELLGNNCEHFATKCVYGLEMSRQSGSTKTYADYLLQAIQESNQSFKKMENDLIEKGILEVDDHQAEPSISNDSQQIFRQEEEIVEINNNQHENQYITQIQIPPK